MSHLQRLQREQARGADRVFEVTVLVERRGEIVIRSCACATLIEIPSDLGRAEVIREHQLEHLQVEVQSRADPMNAFI